MIKYKLMKDIHTHSDKSSVVVGGFEVVSFPDLGITGSLAKIDTGAYSGAIGCVEASVEGRGPNKVLHFRVAGNMSTVHSTKEFKVRYVRSSNGSRHKRYLIKTTIQLKGRVYAILIGLADRSDMKNDVLVGRKFLRDNNILVDLKRNHEYDTDEGFVQ